nr:glycoside hydrolase family 125 protein [Pilibacter termitis]
MEEISTIAQKENPMWAEIFNNCFTNTLETVLKPQEDGTVYVLTGDIPAMWLRDSVAQVRPYLPLANRDEKIKQMLVGVVKRQFDFINIDPYANAFNETANNAGHIHDITERNAWIWERKYEIDSLCYPIQLAYLLYLNTGETSQFDEKFVSGIEKVLSLWKVEQDHENSPYQFWRKDAWRPEDGLSHEGRGRKTGKTGMTWSGFRPSDDSCTYHYLVPSNMFAVVVLEYIQDIFSTILDNENIVKTAKTLQTEIQEGIEKYAVVQNKFGKEIYAYEVDGLGNYEIMDDANIPSLLSSAYLGYHEIDDIRYQSTRASILSKENRYYYTGDIASGIGSFHTPENYIWHMAIAMEGLTTNDKAVKKEKLNLMANTTAGKNLMHEGFHKDDDKFYTREWFSWPNMMFCELLMDYFDIKIQTKKG